MNVVEFNVFFSSFLSRQNRSKDMNVGYFNPVNKDHRRLAEEHVNEEPEWMAHGPTSRFETIELGGFDGLHDHGPPSTSANLQRQRNPPNYAQPFQFDDFLGPEDNLFNRNTRARRYKSENFPPAAGIAGTNFGMGGDSNIQGNLLLNILHGQMKFPPDASHGNFMNTQMTNEPLMRQFNANNKQFMSDKSIVDVISAFQQQQQRQQMYKHQQERQQLGDQVFRMFELHRQIQEANPHLNNQATSPQFWEMINRRQQLYYQQHQQTAATQRVPYKKGRHVHFSPQSHEERMAQFFAPEVVAQASNVKLVDADKAMKVEEFERKIKEVAATCKKQQQK